MSDSRLMQLIREENNNRRLAQAHERKAEFHWNKANELMLEIMAQGENEKELDCSEQY